MKYVAIINNQQFEVEIEKDGTVKINGEQRAVDFLTLGPSLYSVITDTKSVELVIEEEKGKYEIQMGGRLYEGMVLDERAMLMAQRRGGITVSSGELRSPMPGLIIAVLLTEGERVEAGQTVVILESMKMQNELKATISGVISSVHVQAGQTVDKDAVLVNINAE